MDRAEKDEKERPEKSLQGMPYMWKGFLSNTTPFTHDILKTKNIIKISLGSKHCAFLTNQRSVYTYGNGEYGQLGHKKFTDVTKQPVLVQELKSENVADVVCGNNHTGVVCEDGIVFCWGDSTNGQCGIGVSEKVNIPTQVHISDADCDPVITQLSCGDSHTLAMSTQGEVWAWGTGPQLGLSTGSTPVLSPKKVSALMGRKVLQMACGGTMSLVLVQRLKSMRSPGNKSNEPEEEGSGSSLTCQDTVYTMHDEGDTVIISDNSLLCPDSGGTTSRSRSISPDSIDVAAIHAQQAEWAAATEAVDKKRRERGSTSSQGSSEGTYTLEDSSGNLKRIKEEASEQSGSQPNGVAKNGIDGGCAEEDEDDVFTTSKGTKELLAEQLKPLNIQGSPAQGVAPQQRPGPSTRILASLPQSVALRLEKIMMPRTSLTETISRASSDNSICETELIIRDKDAQALESSCNLPDRKLRTMSPLMGGLDDLVYQTEVWSFGKGTMGQLGQGDTLDKHTPNTIKQLSSKSIVRIVAGASHCVAISSNGQVYTWGCNSDGQLGHTGQLVPKRVKMPNNTPVWDAAVGGTHTLLLADGTNCMPDVYYLGKQPSLQELRASNSTPTPESPLRDGSDKSKKRPMSSSISKSPTVKYAARAKQPEKLAFLKKNGWLQAVAASSDQCACIADKSSNGFVAITHEFSATERLLYSQLASIKSSIIKTLQSSEVQKSVEGTIYSGPLRLILDLYGSICGLVAQNCLHLTGLVQRNKDLWDVMMLKEIGRYIQLFQEYANAVCDFITITGFTHLGKVANDALAKHDAVFAEVLNEEKPTVYGAPLRMAMKLPLDRIKTYSYLLTKLRDYYPEDSGEYSLLGECSASWEELKKTVEKKQSDADDTRTFWESCPAKLAESIKSPDRRLIRDSRTKPLQVANAKRLSTHWFLLFNDILVHAYFSNHQIFSLALVWAEPIPDTDQVTNAIQLNMPEESLVLQAPSPVEKAEWLWSINQAIDSILTTNQKSLSMANQKSPSPDNTQRDGGAFQKVPPKRTRQGRHAFSSAGVHKDAVYEGTWLNGKCNGKGTLRWPDGKKYTGNFVQGVQHGHGVFTVPGPDPSKQEVFEGQWLEGKMHGVGILRYQNGDVYEGEFQDGVKHGHGTLQIGNAAVHDIYIGNWRHGKRHGYGVIDDNSRGEKYMGLWQDDHRHGNGLVITLSGLYYEAVFAHNKVNSAGVLVTEDGTCYEGELATGPTLNGKGTLTLPNGDVLEGTFNGIWGDGVKINGTFSKGMMDQQVKRPCAIGRHTVYPDQKWEDIFGQCRTLLGFVDFTPPDSHKAWEAVAVALSSGHRLQDTKEGLERRISLESNSVFYFSFFSLERRISLEGLERIPTHNRGKITQEDYTSIQEYLDKAFDHPLHPLGRLVDNLVNVYRATYIGVGAHHWLLLYAVTEIHSYVKRLYNLLRVLFPDLPSEEPRVKTPVMEQTPSFHYYYDYGEAHSMQPQNAPYSSSTEKDKDDISHQITSEGLLHPTLLPRLYPVIFTLYALRNEKEDEHYRDRLARLNKQSDLGLMAYLGVDQKFWKVDETTLANPGKLKETKDASFLEAIDSLQNISTTFCPIDKLHVIEASFEGINNVVNSQHNEGHVWSMDDLFPVFQYVVVRARIPHLGSEIQFTDDMMDPNLTHGKLGIMFTTLKACYMHTKNDNLKTL
ncbi:alsin isoform X3 [Strongylocentrotus purpuratus]|uniref:Alsin n=1 Tax=Strongylocentrotus purpuratus TaxID=7668 RepID=A0A7M7STW3_STRPU|nr:alsin isoform X3 [Strongylocentrotus purpuratus]